MLLSMLIVVLSQTKHPGLHVWRWAQVNDSEIARMYYSVSHPI